MDLNWLTAGIAAIPGIFAGVTSLIAMGHSKKTQQQLTNITPTLGAVMNALPAVQTHLTGDASTLSKVDSVLQDVAGAIGPVVPEAVPIAALADVLLKLADSITLHANAVTQAQAPEPPK